MKQEHFHITRDHIVSLVGGIFSCAMTLMFFSVTLPKGIDNLTPIQLHIPIPLYSAYGQKTLLTPYILILMPAAIFMAVRTNPKRKNIS